MVMKKLLPTSLMARLTGYFLLLVLIAGGSTVYITFTRAKEALKQSAFDRLVAVAALKENELRRWVEQQKQSVILIANLPEIRQQAKILLTQKHSTRVYKTAYRQLGQVFDEAKKAIAPDLEEIFLLSDVGGKIVVSTEKTHEGEYRVQDPYFTQGRLGTFVQKVYASPVTFKPTLTIAMPVCDQKQKCLGVLAAHVNLTQMDEIIQERTGLGRTGQTYVVDALNNFVSAKRFGTEQFPRGVHTVGVDKALQGLDGVDLYPDYKNIPVIGVYRWIEQQELALLAEMHQAEAFAPAHQLAERILLIGFIAITLSTIIIYLLARQITRPIHKLVEVAQAIRAGDLTQQVKIYGLYELGELAETFNSMTAQLRATLANLEQHVTERTQELATVNRKLQEDIIERERTEQILKESERRLAETQKLAHLGSWEFDIATQTFAWSEETFNITGFDFRIQPPSLEDYLTIVHPRDAVNLLKNMQKAMKEGISYEMELRHRRPDGSYHHAIAKGQPITEGETIVKLLGYILDITERKHTEEKLRKLSRAVEQSANMIIITDLTGTIEFVNPAFSTYTGYPYEEAVGRTPRLLKSGQTPPETYQQLWGTLARGEVWQGEIINKRKSGEIYWEFATISPIKDNHGKTTHYLAIKEDISKRKQAEKQLEKQNLELQAKNKELEILNGKLADAQRERLFQLNKAYERFVPKQLLSLLDKESILDVHLGDQVEKEMTILFSDIRDFTAISEKMSPKENFDFINTYLGQMEPSIEENHGFVDKYVGDAIMALFPTADDGVRGAIAMLKTLSKYNMLLQLANFAPIRIGIGVHTGPLMLGTVGGRNRMDGTVISDAVNLASRIENLTKTYRTPLLITLQTYQHLKNPDQYKIRVVDSVKVKGKSDKITVFEVFDADDPKIIERKLATLEDFKQGIALYQHNEFRTARALFYKVLQVNEDDKVAQVYLENCQDNLVKSLQRLPTILVVDDSQENLLILSHLLMINHFEVLTAENGVDALKIARQESPHLIILDVMMPELDGFETCKQLKMDSTTRNIPVIFMTMLTDMPNKIKGFEVGAIDYITKPFQCEEILARINAHLSNTYGFKKVTNNRITH